MTITIHVGRHTVKRLTHMLQLAFQARHVPQIKRLRALRLLADAHPVETVAERVGVWKQTMYHWVHALLLHGWARLYPGDHQDDRQRCPRRRSSAYVISVLLVLKRPGIPPGVGIQRSFRIASGVRFSASTTPTTWQRCCAMWAFPSKKPALCRIICIKTTNTTGEPCHGPPWFTRPGAGARSSSLPMKPGLLSGDPSALPGRSGGSNPSSKPVGSGKAITFSA